MADAPVYDEFALFHENAEEFGIPWTGPPTVRRVEVQTSAGTIRQQVDQRVFGQTNAFTVDTSYSDRDPKAIPPAEII